MVIKFHGLLSLFAVCYMVLFSVMQSDCLWQISTNQSGNQTVYTIITLLCITLAVEYNVICWRDSFISGVPSCECVKLQRLRSTEIDVTCTT